MSSTAPVHDVITRRLAWPESPVDCVLDTDTYNEIDDQFALVYSVLSGDRVNIQAVYAAPFHNSRSSSPADGMQKSYDEIRHILGLLGRSPSLALRGSDRWLRGTDDSVASDARDDLIERARGRSEDSPLYVAAIGAITNVASALAAAPDIRDRIVVLWLGGQPLYWQSAHEFNLAGDLIASRHVFDCGVPLVLFPCALVAESLRTTVAELDRHLRGLGRVGDYLFGIFERFEGYDLTKPGASKVIWDLAPIAWLVDREAVATSLVPGPVLTDQCRWASAPDRHPIRVAERVNRDRVYSDLFAKVGAFQATVV